MFSESPCGTRNLFSTPRAADSSPGYSGGAPIQTYAYDALNRITLAEEKSNNVTQWKQTFIYDRYGNRRFDMTNTTVPDSQSNQNITNPQIDTSNNRFSANQGYDYDPSGNVTKDATDKRFAYDAENKQTSFGTNGSSTNGGNYFYDGDGRRVKKVVGTETTISVYNASGQLVAEYSTTAVQNPQTSYLTTDTLGTPRINTDANGQVTARHDYMPFGEEIASGTGGRNSAQGYGGQDNIRQKFTQKERDIESDLDFFNSRYYSSALGRFTSADTFGGKLTNPQSLNLYSYVMNNPLKWIDPTGHRAQDPNDPIKPTEDKDENGETIYVETDPEIIKVDVPGKRVGSGVGQPGFWESMIPIWGSGRAAVDDFQNGRYVWGTINGAFAISDVFLVKSIVTAPVKVIGKTIFKEAATETATKTTQRVIVKEALKESDVAVMRLATEGGDFTNLYRAVSPAELDDILKSGNAFRNPPGIEVKYFSSTPEGAASYAQQTFGTGLYQGPYTIVGTQIQTNLIDSSMKVTVDRGIQTVVVPTQHLPALRPAQPFNFTPLPPKLPH